MTLSKCLRFLSSQIGFITSVSSTIYNASFWSLIFLSRFSLHSACSAFLLSDATFCSTPSSQSWTSQTATDLNQASLMRRISLPCSQQSRSGATGSSEITTSGKLNVLFFFLKLCLFGYFTHRYQILLKARHGER